MHKLAILFFSLLLLSCLEPPESDVPSSSEQEQNAESELPKQEEEPQGERWEAAACDTADIPAPDDDGRGLTGAFCVESYANDETGIYMSYAAFAYALDAYFGEPTRQYVMRWETEGESAKPTTIQLRAKVVCAALAGLDDVFLFFSPMLIPEPGEGYSWDVAGSPWWGDVFHFEDKSGLDGDVAKQCFIDGFSLTDFTIVSVK